MDALTTLFDGTAVASLVSLIGMLIHARSKNKKLQAETKHLGTEDVTIVSKTAVMLIEPLQERIAQLTGESNELRTKMQELTAEVVRLTTQVENQRQIIQTNNVKLAASNRRADYYQKLIEDRANDDAASDPE